MTEHKCTCRSTDKPITYKIKKVISENQDVKTFEMDTCICSHPGQFLMLWLPEVDEKPFAIVNSHPLTVSVQKRGEFTRQVLKLKQGDFLGVRGPYGNAFTTDKMKKVCIIAGGVGIATLKMLLNKLLEKKVKVKLIYGAADKGKFIYLKELETNLGKNLYISTDDGSKGVKGYATDVLDELMKKEKFDLVYGCGPEIMLKKIYEITKRNKTNCELSLERYMKCGFGVCGQCAIDDKLVCMDGTVFNSAKLSKLSEFGKFCRAKTGKKVSVDDYSKGICR
ncbi:MAG: dihydroorotate dehydrogenase electron transfer subunit [Candidatus Diapherotrites archaeon]